MSSETDSSSESFLVHNRRSARTNHGRLTNREPVGRSERSAEVHCIVHRERATRSECSSVHRLGTVKRNSTENGCHSKKCHSAARHLDRLLCEYSNMSELPAETKRLSPIDELISPTVRVIREVYEGENAHEMFQTDLNKALFDKVRFIVIEPTRLGEETERWIAVGNCLHKTSLISGAASIAISLIWREKLTIYSASFCAVSMFCTSLYAICWTCDPCVEYQVERKQRNLMKIPVPEGASSPVVLVHTGNRLATYSHRIMTALATSVCVWTVYRALK